MKWLTKGNTKSPCGGESFVKTETGLQLYFIISFFFYLRVTVNVIFLVIVVKLFIKQVNIFFFF